MKKYDGAVVATLMICLALAFMALLASERADRIHQIPWVATQNPSPADQQGHSSETNQNRPSYVVPTKDGFTGIKYLDPDQCYQGETVGDCAARVVQGKVLDLYIFLFVIGVFEAVIGVLTINVLFRQTKIAERQADISEQAMTIGQWPYLFVDSHEFLTPFGVDPRAGRNPTFEFSVKAHGQSPAILRRFYESLTYEFDVPAPPNNVDLGWAIIDAPLLPGEAWPRASGYTGDTTILTAPGNGRRHFFFIGAFIYDDLFGNQHQVGFCYVAGRYGGRGIIHGDHNYNYHHIGKPDERI